MSKINFKLLVESLLTEASIQQTLFPPTSRAGSQPFKDFITFFEKAKKYIFEQGKYEKNDTILSFKTAWPYLDATGYIYKILVDSKLLQQNDLKDDKIFIDGLQTSDNAQKLIESIIAQKTNLQIDNNLKAQIISAISDKLKEISTPENYRNYSITRFKQLNDKTAVLAAEPYLNLKPYDGLVKLLQEYGGYDINQINNILYYPGETKFTQQNIEGPVMATIVELSKLMLIFYREYIIDQKEKDGHPIAAAVAMALGLTDDQGNGNIEMLQQEVIKSAGKQNVTTPAGRVIQDDYIKFIKGVSALTIDPSVPAPDPEEIPITPPTPLIQKIGDFQGMTDTGQQIYQTFLGLFNSIKKGPDSTSSTPTGLVKGIFDTIWAASGQSLYGGR